MNKKWIIGMNTSLRYLAIQWILFALYWNRSKRNVEFEMYVRSSNIWFEHTKQKSINHHHLNMLKSLLFFVCIKYSKKFPIFFNLLFSSMNNKSRYVGIQCIQLWQYASIDASIIILRFVYLYDTHREHSFTNHYLFNACIQRRTHTQMFTNWINCCYILLQWLCLDSFQILNHIFAFILLLSIRSLLALLVHIIFCSMVSPETLLIDTFKYFRFSFCYRMRAFFFTTMKFTFIV